MTKVKDEWYKAAYRKLYGFVRRRHPEVLEEYRRYLKAIDERIKNSLDVLYHD